MHHGTRGSWGQGIERRETGRSARSLLYCVIARPHNPERYNDEVGEHDIET